MSELTIESKISSQNPTEHRLGFCFFCNRFGLQCMC